eukprot:CAMPEP_0174920974 /NCGR_PEP_ID=MMETSP1355-20121228/4824_1 /TAXON_ID=464990 /ORGANISM="Hemiselmis tepida, Strain CCMP443" /LENGTH=343 /DNA_ID=CAMNT_0016166403 /DNA_START=191 /DNA_END=1219 /DNA_ORIENTATION=+
MAGGVDWYSIPGEDEEPSVGHTGAQVMDSGGLDWREPHLHAPPPPLSCGSPGRPSASLPKTLGAGQGRFCEATAGLESTERALKPGQYGGNGAEETPRKRTEWEGDEMGARVVSEQPRISVGPSRQHRPPAPAGSGPAAPGPGAARQVEGPREPPAHRKAFGRIQAPAGLGGFRPAAASDGRVPRVLDIDALLAWSQAPAQRAPPGLLSRETSPPDASTPRLQTGEAPAGGGGGMGSSRVVFDYSDLLPPQRLVQRSGPGGAAEPALPPPHSPHKGTAGLTDPGAQPSPQPGGATSPSPPQQRPEGGSAAGGQPPGHPARPHPSPEDQFLPPPRGVPRSPGGP